MMFRQHARALSLLITMILIVFSLAFSFPTRAEAQHTFNSQATPTVPGTIATDFRGIEYVYVPSGTVEMGISEQAFIHICAEVFKDGDETHCRLLGKNINQETGIFAPHKVDVPAFWIDRYPITIAQYEMCLHSLAIKRCRSVDLLDYPNLFDNPKKPQVGADWFDAVFFCNGRNARLPTEEEWEYAAKGPNDLIFPWGNELNYRNVAPDTGTVVVGSLLTNKNWIGVYDLSGNVSQWVENRFTPYPEALPDSEEQTIFPGRRDNETYRVVRGGSWLAKTIALASFSRQGNSPDWQTPDVGFRCARTTDPRK